MRPDHEPQEQARHWPGLSSQVQCERHFQGVHRQVRVTWQLGGERGQGEHRGQSLLEASDGPEAALLRHDFERRQDPDHGQQQVSVS